MKILNKVLCDLYSMCLCVGKLLLSTSLSRKGGGLHLECSVTINHMLFNT